MKRRRMGLVLLFLVVAGADTNKPTVPTLSPPIVLDELDVWRDGGSLGFVIGDQSGQRIKFVVDGGANSPTRGWFFLGVTSPSDEKNAVRVPLAGPAEKQLLNYLSLWLSSKFNQKQLERLGSADKFPLPTRDESNGWQVKRLLDNRDKTIEGIKKARQDEPPANKHDAMQPQTRLSSEKVLTLANAAAVKRGFRLNKYDPPAVKYREEDKTWTVFYQRKDKQVDPYEFGVSVNDQTAECRVMLGK